MTKHRFYTPRAQRGETLVEVLVALLIVTLATLLLASIVSVSFSINLTARQKDEKFYNALSKVEAMNSGAKVNDVSDKSVVIEPVTTTPIDPTAPTETTVKVDVDVYWSDSPDGGTNENLALYKEK